MVYNFHHFNRGAILVNFDLLFALVYWLSAATTTAYHPVGSFFSPFLSSVYSDLLPPAQASPPECNRHSKTQTQTHSVMWPFCRVIYLVRWTGIHFHHLHPSTTNVFFFFQIDISNACYKDLTGIKCSDTGRSRVHTTTKTDYLSWQWQWKAAKIEQFQHLKKLIIQFGIIKKRSIVIMISLYCNICMLWYCRV